MDSIADIAEEQCFGPVETKALALADAASVMLGEEPLWLIDLRAKA
jgi:hypothetical protein